MTDEEIRPDGATTRGSARRRARQVALQVLYAIDLATDRPRRDEDEPVGSAADSARDPEAVFEAVALHFEMPGSARQFAHALVLGVRAKLEAIDARIGARARNWRLSRMAAVDRNILRLATFELCETDTPVPVVLDEAIDLARRYGGDASPGFVNGILDAVARDARGTAA